MKVARSKDLLKDQLEVLDKVLDGFQFVKKISSPTLDVWELIDAKSETIDELQFDYAEDRGTYKVSNMAHDAVIKDSTREYDSFEKFLNAVCDGLMPEEWEAERDAERLREQPKDQLMGSVEKGEKITDAIKRIDNEICVETLQIMTNLGFTMYEETDADGKETECYIFEMEKPSTLEQVAFYPEKAEWLITLRSRTGKAKIYELKITSLAEFRRAVDAQMLGKKPDHASGHIMEKTSVSGGQGYLFPPDSYSSPMADRSAGYYKNYGHERSWPKETVQTRSRQRFEADKLEVHIAYSTWVKIRTALDAISTEFIFIVQADKTKEVGVKIKNVFFLPQLGVGAFTEADQAALDNLAIEISMGIVPGIKDNNEIKGWGHSHANMNVFESGEDEDTSCNSFGGGMDWCISLVVNKKYEYLMRVYSSTPFKHRFDNCDMVIDAPTEAELKEFHLEEKGSKWNDDFQYVTTKELVWDKAAEFVAELRSKIRGYRQETTRVWNDPKEAIANASPFRRKLPGEVSTPEFGMTRSENGKTSKKGSKQKMWEIQQNQKNRKNTVNSGGIHGGTHSSGAKSKYRGSIDNFIADYEEERNFHRGHR